MNAIDDQLLFYAFRYALGRQTYATATVSDALLANWLILLPGTQKLVHKEIRREMEKGLPDEKLWARVLELEITGEICV